MKNAIIKKTAKLIVSSLSVCFLFLQNCHAVAIDKIVVFGDSLSDNGNLYALTTKAHNALPLVPVIPKNPPYYEGRFTNGPVWVENLAKALKVELSDYAYGGSWAESVADSKQIIPYGLGMQVNLYLASAITDFNVDKHLFVIWSGANDYSQGRSDPDYATKNTVASIKDQIDWLIYYGAKNFLILNLPDLKYVPAVSVKGPDFAEVASQISDLHNKRLAKMLWKIQRDNHDVKIVLADVTEFYNDISAHPDNYLIKNVKEACYGGNYYLAAARMTNSNDIDGAKKAKIDIESSPSLKTAYMTSMSAAMGKKPCANPDEYFFWDNVHPTRIVHQIFATLIANKLADNDIIGQAK